MSIDKKSLSERDIASCGSTSTWTAGGRLADLTRDRNRPQRHRTRQGEAAQQQKTGDEEADRIVFAHRQAVIEISDRSPQPRAVWRCGND
jgi:hypothetical protein